jgi:hypothetical protein
MTWGATWAFGGPTTEELDPVLLLWWMRNRVIMEHLPEQRILIQFDFYGQRRQSFWLLIADDDVSVCLTDPGFEVNVVVTADLSVFYQLWLGRNSYREAISEHGVRIMAFPLRARFLAGSHESVPDRARREGRQQRSSNRTFLPVGNNIRRRKYTRKSFWKLVLVAVFSHRKLENS